MAVILDNGTLLSIRATWTNGHDIDNTFCYKRIDSDPVEAARDVLNNWQDHIVPLQMDNYSLVGISYVDINSADGITGFLPFDPAKPHVGSNGAATTPPALCVLVHKNTEARRGQRSGRLYLGPCQESHVDENGNFDNTVRLAWEAAFANFHGGTSDTGAGENGSIHVLHAKPAPLESTSTHVDSYSVDPKLAVQRRRIGR